jgi:opacity protein-like surface antigen
MTFKLAFLTALFVLSAAAQKQDITLSLGTHGGSDTKQGMTLGANYGYRFFENNKVALFGEFQFIASPNRKLSLNNPQAIRDVASIFAVPGVRLHFAPGKRISPFVTSGFGAAVYERSELLQNGQPALTPRTSTTGAFMYGGGVDVKIFNRFGLRGEIRDFYTGRPDFNVPTQRAHNPVVSIGIRMEFGGK